MLEVGSPAQQIALFLAALRERCPLRLRRVGHVSLEAELVAELPEPRRWAEGMIDLCSDLMDSFPRPGGDEPQVRRFAADRLAEQLATTRSFTFWWD